jgi:uncharacterized protein (TIGR03067 family)
MRRESLLTLIPALAVGVVVAGPCPPIEGLDPLMRPGRILLLGEIHGTEESPAFALDVACHAARAKLPVIIGLELSPAEQERVDTFLDSMGTEADRNALLAGGTWQRSYQDGRNSRAMAELIDGARRLRSEGFNLRVALFDASGSGGGQQRDRRMGANLAAVATAAPEAMLIVLTGNQHSRVTRGTPRNSSYEPMGHVLANGTSHERVVALNVAHGPGSAWICAPDCGTQRLGGRQGELRWTIEIDEATRPAGHQGWYHVGGITASPPAGRPDLAEASESTVVDPASPAAEPSPTRTRRAVSDQASTGEQDDERPLSEAQSKVQGPWQAYDFGANTKTWKIRFDERNFHAAAGTDDWYEGRIVLRPDEDPAQIDFAIDDCRCSYKGMTSNGIYYWDDDSLVIAAPQPGSQRPKKFVERSGQMMRLRKLNGE